MGKALKTYFIYNVVQADLELLSSPVWKFNIVLSRSFRAQCRVYL